MEPTTVIAIVIQAAEAIDKVKSLFGKKPKVKDPIAEIKPYLNAILEGMEVIRQQNIAIYSKLTALPEIIDNMQRERDLENVYGELETLRIMFDQMGEDAQFDVVTSAGYVKIMTNLNYIFQNEPKIGNLGRMLVYVDFADLATKQRNNVRSVLCAFIQGRENIFSSLMDLFRDRYVTQFNGVQSLLAGGFFKSSNIETIRTIHDLVYAAADDKYVTVMEAVVTRVIDNDIPCCRVRYKEVVTYREVQVLDAAFSKGREAAVSSIKELVEKTKMTEDTISAIHTDLVVMRWYRENILTFSHSFVGEESFLFDPDEHEITEKGLAPPPFVKYNSHCYSP